MPPSAMKFVSCRDASSPPREYTFEEAVLTGWAHDGGMIVPKTIPKVEPDMLVRWNTVHANESLGRLYTTILIDILRLYIPESEVDETTLQDVVDTALSTFGDERIVPVTKVEFTDKAGMGDLYVNELYHGPSAAFKDLGMQVLVGFLDLFCARRGVHRKLLVSTSGDTGSSAACAVVGKSSLDLCVLYPLGGRISKVQEGQMTSVVGPNIRVVGVEGSSDDTDIPVEELFGDADYKTQNSLGSVNSVNICRVLVQIAHYFHSYVVVAHEHGLLPSPSPTSNDDEDHTSGGVVFFIPTGGAGHITAGILAKKMGLPATKLVAATNENDVMCRLINGKACGVSDVKVTNAPSCDIMVPYNIERLIFLSLGADASAARQTREWILTFKAGRSNVQDNVVQKLPHGTSEALAQLGLVLTSTTEAQVTKAISRIFHDSTSNYIIEPHTALGVWQALQYNNACGYGSNQGNGGQSSSPLVIAMACAHASKFVDQVAPALGLSSNVEATRAIERSCGENRLLHATLGMHTAPAVPTPSMILKATARHTWATSLRAIVDEFAEQRRAC